MSGDWPPEWDDPEEEFPSGAEQQDAAAEARLAEVSAYLASVPAPVLPVAVAARISAALAAESAARAGDGAQAEASSLPAGGASAGADTTAGAGTSADWDGILRPPPARARVRRHRRGARDHYGSRSRPLKAITSVMAGLAAIAAIGYGISRTGGSVSSSSGPSAGYAAEAPAGSGSSSSAASSVSSAAASSSAGPSSLQIVVTASGTKYQATSLAAQVRARLSQTSNGAASVPGPGATSSVPAAGASKTASTGVTHAPTALRGCVLQLTGGQPPRLLDRATYEGKPAYVIASSSRVWVVGLGCTAANAELITSAPLGS